MSDIETVRRFLVEAAARRLPEAGASWLGAAVDEVGAGVDADRFCALISLASRHARAGALSPEAEERRRAAELVPGWDPERWQVMEAARSALVLAHPGLAGSAGVAALEEAFRYADVGELCALYKSLHLAPEPERFAWRGGEGCRSNMRAVFESVACDGPFPLRAFDEPAWNQMCIKALFIGAPLWRVHGFDERQNAELARMALDLAEERRSAGRNVQPELWMCVGAHGGDRARASIERELEATNQNRAGRRAAALALARAGLAERLEALLEHEREAEVATTMRAALSGETGRRMFAALHPE